MNPPTAGDALPTYNFLSEILPAANFGKTFQFERFFDFADGAFATADLEDGVWCSWSVVSYVSVNGNVDPTDTPTARRVSCYLLGMSIFFALGIHVN